MLKHMDMKWEKDHNLTPKGLQPLTLVYRIYYKLMKISFWNNLL